MINKTPRLNGGVLLIILVLLGLTLATGANVSIGIRMGIDFAQIEGMVAPHEALGIVAFLLVLGHVWLNGKAAALHTRRIFATGTKEVGSRWRLRGAVALLLLIFLALADVTGFQAEGKLEAMGASAELGSALHHVFIGLTVLFLLGHIVLSRKMIAYQIKRIFPMDEKK